jgi:hypothetical protein
LSSRRFPAGARRGVTAALALLVCAILLPPGASPAAEVPDFSGPRAMAWLTAQCDLGPRPPGSPALESLRRLIESHADSLGLRCVRLCFETSDPWRGGPLEVCNLVVSAGPAGGPRFWLGAHYDTRPAADQDPDPARRQEPILGANDGASGTAVLLHLMELLAASPPPRGVDLLFFDAEDSGRSGDPGGFCVGSRHLAATWNDFPSPLAGSSPQALVVLDMIGHAGLDVGMEGYSLRLAPDLTRAVFERAADLGLRAFAPVPAVPVYDDHVPFLQAGIPAVDLIDFGFAQWHTVADTPEVCDPASLAAAGRLAASLIWEPLQDF